jgi:chromosomal replication initiation ATPase DnaA
MKKTRRELTKIDIQNTVISMRIISKALKFDGTETKRDIVYAKKIYIYYLCNHVTELSLQQIGKLLGISKHSGVIYHRNDINDIITVDSSFKKFVDNVVIDISLAVKYR